MNSRRVILYIYINSKDLCFILKAGSKKQDILLKLFRGQTPMSNSELQIFKGNLTDIQGAHGLRRVCKDKQSKEQSTHLVMTDIQQSQKTMEISFIQVW